MTNLVWSDSEAIIRVRRSLRAYEDARAKGDLITASGMLAAASLDIKTAEEAVLDELKRISKHRKPLQSA